MKRLIITGAAGFIGRHIIPFLLEKDYEIHALYYGAKPDIAVASKNLFWHECDLLNLTEQKKILSDIKATYLLHLAWHTVHKKYWTAIDNFAWVQASMELFKNFTESGGRRFIGAGTCAEYDWNYGYCSENITPLNPNTLYGFCKNSLRELLSRYANENGVSFAWGRIFFLYGPYEHPQRLVPYVIRSLLKNQTAQCSHGNQIRDFLHVEDVASAFVRLIECNVEDTVNIASGIPITIKDLINKIAEKLNKAMHIKLGAIPASDSDPKVLFGDASKLREDIGWEPRYDLDSGLAQTIKW